MAVSRKPIRRVLPGTTGTDDSAHTIQFDAPRTVRSTVIDFASLGLPVDVRLLLAEAFWVLTPTEI